MDDTHFKKKKILYDNDPLDAQEIRERDNVELMAEIIEIRKRTVERCRHLLKMKKAQEEID